jgi:hypothetical protein
MHIEDGHVRERYEQYKELIRAFPEGMGMVERYGRLMDDYAERFAEDAGYRLRDPFDHICTMLAAGTPFSFSRFGDGEFNAIFEVGGRNASGHRYFPDLGRRLKAIVESKPDYMMGLLVLAVLIHGAERILSISRDIRWVSAGGFQSAVVEGRLGPLFDALSGRQVMLVGPRHLLGLAESKGWEHIEVPSKDCWLQYEDITVRLKSLVPGSDSVVLFCASMMSNVLIDDLYHHNSANTYLDIGSAFDPSVGVRSRAGYSEIVAAGERPADRPQPGV